jgi:hypothetical protein
MTRTSSLINNLLSNLEVQSLIPHILQVVLQLIN